LTVTEVLALVLVEVRGALEREIDRLGRARRPHELLRVAADERRDVLARFLDRGLRGPPERVRARRGLPNSSVRYVIIFCATRGSTGVVAEVIEIDRQLLRESWE
jgi:hypothetical protein